jgi:hypothetical protein
VRCANFSKKYFIAPLLVVVPNKKPGTQYPKTLAWALANQLTGLFIDYPF